MIVGLVISVWGGILVQQQVQERHNRELTLKSEKFATKIGLEWANLNGELQALRAVSSLQKDVQERRSQMALDMVASSLPVEGLAFVAVDARGGASVKSGIGKIGLDLPDAVQSAYKKLLQSGELTHNLAILPLKQNPEDFLWAVARLQPQQDDYVFAQVHIPKLLQAADKNLANLFKPIIKIGFPQEDAQLTFLMGQAENIVPHHVSTLELGKAQWHLNWVYSKQLASQSYMWGFGFAFFALLITGVVLWSLWSQFSTARRVKKEVVERTKELEHTSRQFRLITDNAYDLITIISVTGSVEYVNSAYNRVLGYPRKTLYGQELLVFIHDEDQKYVQEAIKAVVDGRPVSEVNFRFKTRQNTLVYMEAIAKGIFDNSWNLTGIVLHSRNVTARKRYADELARSEQRFKDFADSSADWLWETNKHYNFVYVSPGVKGTLGHLPKEMLGKPMFEVLFTSKDDATRELIENLSKRHQSYREIEFWTRTNTGERVCLRLSAIPIFDGIGEFAGYRGAATNITASKVDSENMLRLATTDHLTGLLNRSRFMEELDHTITLARRHNTQGVVLFLDMDRFKAVNDTHGHAAGDAVIKGVASIIKKSMRSTDVISRLAGDEFAIIMHNIDSATAYQKVENLIERINKMQVDYQGARLQVTMSVGMVGYPVENKDASQLLTSADLAMYKAKDMGRNQIYVDEEIGESDRTSATVRVQLEWIERLRDALAYDKFEMHYQPIVPSRKDAPMIYEALIRLRDEEGNLGAPGLFIDAAEHFGMIRGLDRAVVERCIKTQSEMEKNGQSPILSLNLSGVSFGDNELLENMKKFFKKYKADPRKFIFEVTETAAMRDIDQARSFVKELKKLGSKFALDDFGVGFSSFFYIKHLEVDYIKIDGSYIKNLDTSKEDRLFVKSLVDLATGLNIQTVAEFVENKEILDELEKMNVNYVQGYYLSKPMEHLGDLYNEFNGLTARQKSKEIEKKKTLNAKDVKKTGAKKTKQS